MKTIISLAFSILTFIVSSTAFAALMTPEQIEINTLMEKMYSYDPVSFEYGEFDPQLRPFTRKYPPNKHTKYIPAERCKLLRTMFLEAMLPVTPPKKECDVVFSRLPNVYDKDMFPATRGSFVFTEKFTIGSPVAQGNRAKVAVFTTKARNLYFLTKTDQGWRVSNAMIHSEWPDLDDRAHNCMFKFALPPSPEEKKEVLPHCR